MVWYRTLWKKLLSITAKNKGKKSTKKMVSILIKSTLNQEKGYFLEARVDQDTTVTFEEFLKDVEEYLNIAADIRYKVALTKEDPLADATDIDITKLNVRLEELNLVDDDVLLVDEKKEEGGSDGTGEGYIYVANATDEPWIVEVSHKRIAQIQNGEPERSIKIKLGSIYKDGFSLGEYEEFRGRTEYEISNTDEYKLATIKPHVFKKYPYTNEMPKHEALHATLLARRKDDLENAEMITLENGSGVIITKDNGFVDSYKHWITGRMYHWVPMVAPTHNKNLTYDPHKTLKNGTACGICKQ